MDQIPMSDGGSVELTLVDVTEVTYSEPGMLRWSSAAARKTAGLDDYASLLYSADPDADRLIAVGTTKSIDGRSQSNAATIRSSHRAVSFPKGDLEDALGITADDVQTDEPIRLAIFAGDGVLAFRRVDDLAGVVVDEELVDEIRDV